VLFPFVRLEFTSALGPSPGRYPLAVTREDGDPATDALLIKVVGAPAPARLLRRPRAAAAGEAPRELSVLQITWVRSSAGLPSDDAVRRFIGELGAEEVREALISEALEVVNAAVVTYAISVADPFAREVSRFDPREVHVGVGAGAELDAGGWTHAVACPPPPTTRPGHGERLRPDAAVAGVLAGGRPAPPRGMLHLVRALLDAEMGRLSSAAAELVIGLELLGDDRVEQARALRAAPDAEAVSKLARAVLSAA
jgi:hypothetical protein